VDAAHGAQPGVALLGETTDAAADLAAADPSSSR